MGNILSALEDAADDYKLLCEKYNEKYTRVYSHHHRWLEDLDSSKTELTFEEYKKEVERKELQKQIYRREQELKDLKNELQKR